jgi:hypothetical protein
MATKELKTHSLAEMKDKRFIITSPACVLQAHR